MLPILRFTISRISFKNEFVMYGFGRNDYILYHKNVQKRAIIFRCINLIGCALISLIMTSSFFQDECCLILILED